MKCDELVKLFDETLSRTMQHIYQPLLIRSLVEMGGCIPKMMDYKE